MPGAGFGVTDSEIEAVARLRLEKYLARLEGRDRVCGVVLRPPIVSAIVQRIRVGVHDLVVMPDDRRELLVKRALQVKTNVPLLLVHKRGAMCFVGSGRGRADAAACRRAARSPRARSHGGA